MPLIRVADILQVKQTNHLGGDSSLQVIVYADQDRSVGLVIDRILDIVDESITIQGKPAKRGVLGSAVIQQRITDILDVPALLEVAKERAHARTMGFTPPDMVTDLNQPDAAGTAPAGADACQPELEMPIAAAAGSSEGEAAHA